MAPKKAGTRKALEQFEETPEVPDTIQRDRWDRPLIVPADGGKAIAYTRASTLGKAIEDTYHLSRWLQRNVAFGLSRRPDLLALVAAISTNEGEDRGPLDELCEKAHEAAKGDKGANVGTALHKLSERRDAGEDLSYLPALLLDAINAYTELMKLFEVLASETFVACDPLQAAGSFDRVVRLLVPLRFHHATKGNITLPTGTVLVLDLKTSKAESAKYWGSTYGVQQTVYACGDPYLPGTGRRTWEQMLGEGNRPSTDWALLLHVPSDSPQDAGLVIVDLEAGAAMADLCLEVREARKSKALMSDCYPAEDLVDIFLLISEATDEDVLAAIYQSNENLWGPQYTEAVKQRLAAIAAAKQAPAQVTKIRLIAQLRNAPDEESLAALYRTNKDAWSPEHTAMVKARISELKMAVARAHGTSQQWGVTADVEMPIVKTGIPKVTVVKRGAE
jgi:hypothetical protein